jgi:hypothetical protein
LPLDAAAAGIYHGLLAWGLRAAARLFVNAL